MCDLVKFDLVKGVMAALNRVPYLEVSTRHQRAMVPNFTKSHVTKSNFFFSPPPGTDR